MSTEDLESRGMRIYEKISEMLEKSYLKDVIKEKYAKEIFNDLNYILNHYNEVDTLHDYEYVSTIQRFSDMIRRVYLGSKAQQETEENQNVKYEPELVTNILRFFVTIGVEINLNDW